MRLVFSHRREIDCGRAVCIFWLNPPEEIGETEEWNVSQGHGFKGCQRKVVCGPDDRLGYEPTHLRKGEELRCPICVTSVFNVLLS